MGKLRNEVVRKRLIFSKAPSLEKSRHDVNFFDRAAVTGTGGQVRVFIKMCKFSEWGGKVDRRIAVSWKPLCNDKLPRASWFINISIEPLFPLVGRQCPDCGNKANKTIQYLSPPSSSMASQAEYNYCLMIKTSKPTQWP